MDQNPQDNHPPISSSYKSQYHWLSPLRDIQLDTFNPEDNPIPGIDPRLITERATNTSARAGPSTHLGYQPWYNWLSPLRDIQPGIFNPELTSNSEDNPISGIDPELFTERATNSSARAGPSTHSCYQHQDIQINNQSFTWPTTSVTGKNQSSNTTSLDTDTRWPAYQGQNAQNMKANMKTPSTNFTYPDTKHRSDPLQNLGKNLQISHIWWEM